MPARPGKGFAVVASEVKSLANQTAKATEEIAAQIADMQSVAADAVRAIGGISKTISEISNIAETIAAAVEEQGAATREIAATSSRPPPGTQEVSQQHRRRHPGRQRDRRRRTAGAGGRGRAVETVRDVARRSRRLPRQGAIQLTGRLSFPALKSPAPAGLFNARAAPHRRFVGAPFPVHTAPSPSRTGN